MVGIKKDLTPSRRSGSVGVTDFLGKTVTNDAQITDACDLRRGFQVLRVSWEGFEVSRIHQSAIYIVSYIFRTFQLSGMFCLGTKVYSL